MPFDVIEFMSRLSGGGARPTLFDVIIPGPRNASAVAAGNAFKGAEACTYMCKAAQLPGKDIGVIEVPYFGRKLKFAGDATFQEWSITIINDENFAAKDFFEAWQNAINTHISNLRAPEFASIPSAYMCDLTANQYGKDGQVVKQYTFKGAWPSSVAPIEVGWENSDTLEEFQVTFQYSWWESRATEMSSSINDVAVQ